MRRLLISFIVFLGLLLPQVLLAATVYTPGAYSLGSGSWFEYFPDGEGQASSKNVLTAIGIPWTLVGNIKTSALQIGDLSNPADYDFKTVYNVIIGYVGPGAWGSALTLQNVDSINLSKRLSYTTPYTDLAFQFTTAGIITDSSGVGYLAELKLIFDSEAGSSIYSSIAPGYPLHTGSFNEGLTLTISQVPIPGAAWLLASALVGIVAIRKKMD